MKQLVVDRKDLLGSYETFKVQDFISRLNSLIESIPEEYRDSARIDMDTVYEPYEPDPYMKVFVKFQRMETDQEEMKREKEEKKFADEKEERDRLEFERLAKKFSK